MSFSFAICACTPSRALCAIALAAALSACSTPPQSAESHTAGSHTAQRYAMAPTTVPFACDDVGFLTVQRRFAAGSAGPDQLVDICGTVTAVLAQRTTRSGTHGYFYLSVASGSAIEIISNLDAMGRAPSNRPPASWPWVAVGDYVFVQGRYYYDSPHRQGIDWTEDDAGRSWPYPGYVAVCNASKTNCAKYW